MSCDVDNDADGNNTHLYFMWRSKNGKLDGNEFVPIQQMLHSLHFVNVIDYERAKLWK